MHNNAPELVNCSQIQEYDLKWNDAGEVLRKYKIRSVLKSISGISHFLSTPKDKFFPPFSYKEYSMLKWCRVFVEEVSRCKLVYPNTHTRCIGDGLANIFCSL